MSWRVMVGLDPPWVDPYVLPTDPETGWGEAWDGIVPGYRAALFERERDAATMARRMRAFGYIAANGTGSGCDSTGLSEPTVPTLGRRLPGGWP